MLDIVAIVAVAATVGILQALFKRVGFGRPRSVVGGFLILLPPAMSFGKDVEWWLLTGFALVGLIFVLLDMNRSANPE